MCKLLGLGFAMLAGLFYYSGAMDLALKCGVVLITLSLSGLVIKAINQRPERFK